MQIWNWENGEGGYNPSHKRALENKLFDRPPYNEGWTSFGHEKAEIKDCRTCRETLEERVKKFMQDGEAIDTTFLKSCLKPLLTVPANMPINVLNFVLVKYAEKYPDNIVYGKFGGSGHDGERILLFYEEDMEGVEQRLEELQTILDEFNMPGKLSYSTACDFMLYHLKIGEKTKVRQPEFLLEELKRNF